MLDAPGLNIFVRDGKRVAYWVAPRDARKRGYQPKTVRLHGDLDSAATLQAFAARCRVLQADMLGWLNDPAVRDLPIYDGAIRSLIDCYQRDPRSPFHQLRQNTQQTYAEWCRALERVAGSRRVDKLVGSDLREWYDAIRAPRRPGEAPRERLARGAVPQLLRILINYGLELGLPECERLDLILKHMAFRRSTDAPQPVAKQVMSYSQAEAIVTAGLAKGTRRHRSVAIGVAAQFELTLRQIDVIGWYERIKAPREAEAVSRSGKVWRGGLRWEAIQGTTLALRTSKTGTAATFDVSAYPLLVRALAAVPEAERHGAVVVDDSGRPIQKRYYINLYRTLADAAGVPRSVWNARARHGGLTEGYQAIVAAEGEDGPGLADLRYHGQHADLKTTLAHYVNPGAEPSRRVARVRVASRKKEAKG